MPDLEKPIHNPQRVRYGLYRHVKGMLYLVEGLARHHDEASTILVVYRSFEGEREAPGGVLRTRTLEDFTARVDVPNAPVTYVDGGRTVPRFTRVNEIHFRGVAANPEEMSATTLLRYLGERGWKAES